MLTATRKEWNELYVFFSLLAKGSIMLGDADGKPSERNLPIFMISRQEYDGVRQYYIEEENKWAWRHNEGYDIFLTEDEVMKLVGCAMCGKPKVNNWARYCDSRCPYYFDTPSLKEILL